MNSTSTLSRKKQESSQVTESKWDDAINAAKEEIEILANRKKQLEQSVEIFRMNKRDGVPWPEKVVESSSATTKGSTVENSQ